MSRFFRDAWLGLVIAFRELWRGWVSAYVGTLRAITGRRRPDYARIAELELSCGLAGPPPGRASASIQTPNEVRARAGLTAAPARRGSAAWERDYEAGRAKTRAWLDSLPAVPPVRYRGDIRAYREQIGLWYEGREHRADQIEVTALGDRERKWINGRP